MGNVFLCTTVKHVFTALFFADKYLKRESNIILCAIDHQNINNSLMNSYEETFPEIEFIFYNENELINEFRANNALSFSGFLSRNIKINTKELKFELSVDFLKEKLVRMGVPELNVAYIFHDRTFTSKFFLYSDTSEVKMIEDGKVNYYKQPVGNILKSLIRFFLRLDPKWFVLGESPRISKVYYSNIDESPLTLKGKSSSLGDIYSLSKSMQSKMLSFFSYERFNCELVFLTQGLDIAGLCSKADKLNIYDEVVGVILENKEVNSLCIKLHPSESVDDYNFIKLKYGKKVIIEDRKIPFEIYSLLEPKPVAISLFSSSSYIRTGRLTSVINLIEDEKKWRKFDVDEIKKTSISQLKSIDEYF
ncbi:hypothetical protein AHAT_00320 [Agarivorans sp. Toyoura001]|uniref:hypothetical protein n=1 Tax=Agarivorans sp. Toyoura001 TaxID=2283141 RepID=UPI0010E382A5|nr:hypothetical protein [Agarivorans sp. Toyoura001]GDY24142.1 hypothetical protein AHAT_00320 [Agarivorans sp. Toyoura001]